MQDPEYFRQLLKGHLDNALSPEEEDSFLEALRTGSYGDILGKEVLSSLENSLPSAGRPLSMQKKQQIIQHILASGSTVAPVVPIHHPGRRTLRIVAAAAVVMLAVSAFLLYNNRTPHTVPDQPMLAANNNGSAILPVNLEDGSIIELQPGARLSYPAHFTGSTRQVSLEGTAFFKITSDPRHPFFALSKGLVTHVLGTSFGIDWNQQRSELRIAVRSGKVEVHPEEQKEVGQGAILTANQQITYTQGAKSLIPALVDSPQVVEAAGSLIFKATPVSEIFALFQKSYGIDIVMADDKLGKSLFTGDLSHQSFYTALKIICLSLNHTYTVKGTKIFIDQTKIFITH